MHAKTPDQKVYQDIISDAALADVLSNNRTFACVGASVNPNRPSTFVIKYLLGKGYDVIPINPGLAGQEILGRSVYASLDDAPGPIDVVDIFRNSEAALGITRDAIRLKDKLSIRVVWMQLGVINRQAACEAEAAGLTVIMNRCPKIEYGRLSGEIGWAGVNSGSLSSKRPRLAPSGVQDHRLKD
ncbi:MAG: CoA-binding protein [Alphaproteobacteria bacterium]|nr:CoA-binding protein [Alphaproteobacteria bacterium]